MNEWHDQSEYDPDDFHTQPEPQSYAQAHAATPTRRWPWRRIRRLIVLSVAALAVTALCLLAAAGLRSKPTPVAYTSSMRSAPIPIRWGNLRKDLATSLSAARAESSAFAETEVTRWMAELNTRARTRFIDHELSFWQQQQTAVQWAWQTCMRVISPGADTAEQALTTGIQSRFTANVLRPQVAQQRFSRILSQSVAVFVTGAAESLDELPARHGLPQVAWNEHTQNISTLMASLRQTRQVSLPMKLAAATTAYTAVLVAKPVAELARTIVVRVFKRSLVRTGGTVLTRLSGKVLGPLVLGGTIVWDIWDCHMTARRLQPVLERAVSDYLTELGLCLQREIDAQVGLVEVEILNALAAAEDVSDNDASSTEEQYDQD